MSILTISDLELYLQKTITGTSDEDLYSYLITAVQSEAQHICNRYFEETDYTEKYDGNLQDELLLKNYPVISVTSVTIIDTDDSIISSLDMDSIATDQIQGSIYYKGSFPKGRMNISVVYSAGYSDDPSSGEFAVPNDLKTALMDMVEESKVLTITDPNLKKEKLGDYSYERGSVEEVVHNQSYKLKLYIRYD